MQCSLPCQAIKLRVVQPSVKACSFSQPNCSCGCKINWITTTMQSPGHLSFIRSVKQTVRGTTAAESAQVWVSNVGKSATSNSLPRIVDGPFCVITCADPAVQVLRRARTLRCCRGGEGTGAAVLQVAYPHYTHRGRDLCARCNFSPCSNLILCCRFSVCTCQNRNGQSKLPAQNSCRVVFGACSFEGHSRGFFVLQTWLPCRRRRVRSLQGRPGDKERRMRHPCRTSDTPEAPQCCWHL
jgi:hypothetical protein